MKYRLTTTIQGVTNTTEFEGLNDTLAAAEIFLKTNSEKRDRIGSLRGQGRVDMWSGGLCCGYAIVERWHPSLGWDQIS